ncbi:fibronectin type III domain-containing protein, partial [Elusimicrobiota bacterium]
STVTFVDAVNEDFHLASFDELAKDSGTVLSSVYAYDIDGDTRPQGAKWDIGADECTGDYMGTPAGLQVVDIFSSSATVAWNLLNDATGYNLVCSTLSASPPVEIFASTTTSGISATTGTLTGLWPNTTYYFFTKAYGSGKEGAYSSYIATSTLANKVTNAGIYNVGLTSVTINWTALLPTPSSASCQGYIVQASSISDFSSIYSSTSTTDVNLSTLTVTGLNDATTYWFRVGSLNWNNVANYVTVSSTYSKGSPVMIYRSIGPGNADALATHSIYGNMKISTSIADFSGPLPNNIGVGDALQYDSTGDNSIDSIVFIHERLSSTKYRVKDSSGNTPSEKGWDDDWDIYRAYTSLYNAESGRENSGIHANVTNFDNWAAGGNETSDDYGRDLVDNNEIWNIACYADSVDTRAVVVNDWTTDSHYYIRIFTPVNSDEAGTSQRHNGIWDDDKYNIDGNVTWDYTVRVYEPFTRIEGLQINNSGGGGSTALYNEAAANGSVYDDLILTTADMSSAECAMLYNNSETARVIFKNSLLFGSQTGIYLSRWQEYVDIYNVTIVNCSNKGIDLSSSDDEGRCHMYNTIVYNCNINYEDLSDTNKSHNASDESNAANIPGSDSQTDVTSADFVDYAGGDFHISKNSTKLKDTGTDLTGIVDYDIEGDTRPQGAAWDIGMDECTGNYLTAPVGLVFLEVNASSVTVAWDLVNDATGYTLVCSADSDDPPFNFEGSSITVGVDATTATIAGLNDGEMYYFFVQAHGYGSSSIYSDYISTCTLVVSTGTHCRSIGTNTEVLCLSGTASVNLSSNVVTFSGVALPDNVGQGDRLVLDPDGTREVFYISSRENNAEVIVESLSQNVHSGVDYTVKRSFNSIQDWENARDGDLVSDDRVEIGVCYADSVIDDTVIIDGSITSDTNYMKLTAAESDRHTGAAGTGVVIDPTANGHVVDIRDDHTVVEWLEITGWVNTPVNSMEAVHAEADQLVIRNMIIHDNDYANNANADGICHEIDNSTVTVINCIVYNITRGGIVIQGGTNRYMNAYNCTVYNVSGDDSMANMYVGTGNTFNAINCISMKSGRYGDFVGSSWGNSRNNISHDGTAPGADSQTYVELDDMFVSLSTGSEDLHLVDLSLAVDKGTDTISGIFTDDIDGDTRTGTWDIGADESPYLGKPHDVEITGIYTSSVTVTWGKVADATGYYLIAADDFTNPPLIILSSSTTAGVDSTTATITGLTPGEVYYFFVRSNGDGISSAYAGPVSNSDKTYYRSIGTNTGILHDAGTASVAISSNVVTFSVSLSTMIGEGDKITLDVDGNAEVYYILSKDDDTT